MIVGIYTVMIIMRLSMMAPGLSNYEIKVVSLLSVFAEARKSDM
jgi:hypothetical protein